MSIKNIPEIIQLPRPHINMDESINSHLVNILNKGLDNMNLKDVTERFSEDEKLMMYSRGKHLTIDFPREDVEIYYWGGDKAHFQIRSTTEERDYFIPADERSQKALDYVKTYYSEELLVHPYQTIVEDMRYETYQEGDTTIIVVYGLHPWLTAEEFVLFSECAKQGKIVSRYFYEDIVGENNNREDSGNVSGYYDIGQVDERGFPLLSNISVFTYYDHGYDK